MTESHYVGAAAADRIQLTCRSDVTVSLSFECDGLESSPSVVEGDRYGMTGSKLTAYIRPAARHPTAIR